MIKPPNKPSAAFATIALGDSSRARSSCSRPLSLTIIWSAASKSTAQQRRHDTTACSQPLTWVDPAGFPAPTGVLLRRVETSYLPRLSAPTSTRISEANFCHTRPACSGEQPSTALKKCSRLTAAPAVSSSPSFEHCRALRRAFTTTVRAKGWEQPANRSVNTSSPLARRIARLLRSALTSSSCPIATVLCTKDSTLSVIDCSCLRWEVAARRLRCSRSFFSLPTTASSSTRECHRFDTLRVSADNWRCMGMRSNPASRPLEAASEGPTGDPSADSGAPAEDSGGPSWSVLEGEESLEGGCSA